jgi:hypothetical protein
MPEHHQRVLARRGGGVVGDQRYRADQQPRDEPEPVAAQPRQTGPVAYHQDGQGRREVRHDQPVHPQHQSGHQPPTEADQRSSPQDPGGQTDRDQQQRGGEGFDFRGTPMRDQLVFQYPVRPEGQQPDAECREPWRVQAGDQPIHQRQEGGVEEDFGYPQRDGGRPEQRHGRYRQVCLQDTHVVLTVHVDRQVAALNEVQRGEPHGRLVTVGGRHLDSDQPAPVPDPHGGENHGNGGWADKGRKNSIA